MRVKIKSKGPHLIEITNLETGEAINRVQKASWEIGMDSISKVTLEIEYTPEYPEEIDVEAEAILVCSHCKQKLSET